MQDYQDLLEDKKYEGVIKALKDIKEPDYNQQLALGFAYLNLELYANAEMEIKDLYNKNENNPVLIYMLGNIYEAQDRKDKATFFYRKATRYVNTKDDAQAKLDELGYVEELDEETEKIKEIKGFIPKTTFADVKGMKKQKEYLEDHLLLLLKNPELIKRYGKKAGMGLLLFGGPGLGKTYLAAAIGGEAKCFVLIAKRSDLVGQYLGVSGKNTRAIFEQAKANAPCLVFFDEFDSIGVKRSESSGSDKHGGSSHMKEIVDELLIQLQGIDEKKESVFVIVSTNRPWDVDPALRRSGRLEDSLYVAPPNYNERKDSLAYHLSKTKHEGKIDLGRAARAIIGYSHADIEKLIDEIALQTLKKDLQTKQEQWINTKDILKVARNMENSLDPWFLDTAKELLGKKKTEKINGKKVVTQEAGALEPAEKKAYKGLIKDINKNSNPFYRFHKMMVRNVALKLW